MIVLAYRAPFPPAPAPARGWLGREIDASTALMETYSATRDETTFARLYALNRPRIERLVASCLRYGAADLDADAIVQDVFVNVFRFAHHFRPGPGAAFARWSSEIARNAVRRALRTRARMRARLAEIRRPTSSDAPSPEQAELATAVREAYPLLLAVYAEAFARLAPGDRAILRARYLDERRGADLASAASIGVGAIKMRAMRARARLVQRTDEILYGRRAS